MEKALKIRVVVEVLRGCSHACQLLRSSVQSTAMKLGNKKEAQSDREEKEKSTATSEGELHFAKKEIPLVATRKLVSDRREKKAREIDEVLSHE